MEDMMIKLVPIVVDVTENDINEGKFMDCKECPVARALLRVVGEPGRIWFFTQTIQDERREIWTWVNHFDTWKRGDPIRSRPLPTKFTLLVPEDKVN